MVKVLFSSCWWFRLEIVAQVARGPHPPVLMFVSHISLLHVWMNWMQLNKSPCYKHSGLLDHFFGAGTHLISKQQRFDITQKAKLLDENRHPEVTEEHESDPACKKSAESILHTSLNPALLARYQESCLRKVRFLVCQCFSMFVSLSVFFIVF